MTALLTSSCSGHSKATQGDKLEIEVRRSVTELLVRAPLGPYSMVTKHQDVRSSNPPHKHLYHSADVAASPPHALLMVDG